MDKLEMEKMKFEQMKDAGNAKIPAMPAMPVELSEGEPEAGTWYRIPLKNTVASNGTEGNTYLKKGTTDHLIVFFMGGGVSWNQETAKYPITMETTMSGKPGFYFSEMGMMNEYGIFCYTGIPGIISTSQMNPFANWNMVIVNYATADAHTGDNDYPYIDQNGEQKVLHHRGYQHTMECLKTAKKYFPQADKLLICGISGGAFATPALAADVMEQYSDCSDVTVYSDSALILKEDWREVAEHVWKSPKKIYEPIHTNNITADWYRQLYKDKGKSIRYLYSNSTKDQAFSSFINYFQTGDLITTKESTDLFAKDLKTHIATLKSINPEFAIFLNDFPSFQPGTLGTEHCVLNSEMFYKKTQNGKSTAEWLWDAVNGKTYDVGLELLEA